MRRRERLSDLQCSVGRYLLARMDGDGMCFFDGEDLRAQVGNDYPYNIFRQFIVKGLIDELPAKRDDGLWELHVSDPVRFRRAIGAGRVGKRTPSQHGVDNHSSYVPGCAPLRPPLVASPEPCESCGLDFANKQASYYPGCAPLRPPLMASPKPHGLGDRAGIGYTELSFESAMAAIDAEILKIVLDDDFTVDDEKTLRDLIHARKSAFCAGEAAAQTYVLVASFPIDTAARDQPDGRYGFI